MRLDHPIQQLNLQITTLKTAYQEQGLTPRDLVQEVYRRIGATADQGIWTHVVAKEQVLQHADRLSQLDPGSLPLYGIPFAVKDNIHVHGLPTTASCPAFEQYPEETATVVQKMLDAGALLIGKNTMDQFATGLVGVRSPVHPCNSFKPEFIPGGSSSGSAVAVAKGLVSFALASDTGGSGRVPAALNNIVGLKPTPGIVSSHGMVYANRSFDCVPIFALTCADAMQVFESALGYDAKDPFMRRDTSALAAARFPTRGFKVGIPRPEQLKFFGDDLAAEAFQQAITRMQMLGGSVQEIDFEPFVIAGSKLFNGPYLAERLASVAGFMETQRADMDPVVANIIASAAQFSAVDFFQEHYALQALRSRVAQTFEAIDLLLLPTTGTIYRIDQVKQDPLQLNANMGYYTYFSNLLQLAALALPSSIRSDGLPFGVCLLANPLQDFALAALGRRWEDAARLPLGAPVHWG